MCKQFIDIVIIATTKREQKFLLELMNVFRSLPALWNIERNCYSDRNNKIWLMIFLYRYPVIIIRNGSIKEELKKKIDSLLIGRVNEKNQENTIKSFVSFYSAKLIHEPTLSMHSFHDKLERLKTHSRLCQMSSYFDTLSKFICSVTTNVFSKVSIKPIGNTRRIY